MSRCSVWQRPRTRCAPTCPSSRASTTRGRSPRTGDAGSPRPTATRRATPARGGAGRPARPRLRQAARGFRSSCATSRARCSCVRTVRASSRTRRCGSAADASMPRTTARDPRVRLRTRCIGDTSTSSRSCCARGCSSWGAPVSGAMRSPLRSLRIPMRACSSSRCARRSRSRAATASPSGCGARWRACSSGSGPWRSPRWWRQGGSRTRSLPPRECCSDHWCFSQAGRGWSSTPSSRCASGCAAAGRTWTWSSSGART